MVLEHRVEGEIDVFDADGEVLAQFREISALLLEGGHIVVYQSRKTAVVDVLVSPVVLHYPPPHHLSQQSM